MTLVPLLRDSDDDWKKAVFYQYKRRNDMGYSVIKDNLRFTAWVHINSTSLEVQQQFCLFISSSNLSIVHDFQMAIFCYCIEIYC